MDFLLAKLRGNDGTFRKVLSNETIYIDIPLFDDSRTYNDEIKLRDNEWFKIDSFTKKPYAPLLIREPFNAAAWSQIGRNDYEKIDYIVSVQDNSNLFIFQNITSSFVYKRQRFISMDEQPSLLNKDHLIIIHENPDAYYIKDIDCLYFQRLSKITSVFQGINELYKEATNDEVEQLLKLDILNVSADFTKNKVKTANRRRIREAMDKYNQFSEMQKEALPAYFTKYCPNINIIDSQISIEDEKTLTMFLNGLNQRYYTTEISNEKRLALSVDNIV